MDKSGRKRVNRPTIQSYNVPVGKDIIKLQKNSPTDFNREYPQSGHIARFFLLSCANFCSSLSPTKSL